VSTATDKVTTERRGHLLLIGVNRPEKRNAWDVDVIQGVARAYTRLATDAALRVGVLFGHGDVFTAGLDLAAVAPLVADGRGAELIPSDLCDPWDLLGEPCPKPIVLAVHGRCYTLGIELALASQACIVAAGTQFAQLEVGRGIVPLGGASFRLPMKLGPTGMRWLLTAETFDADQALAAGLVTEVVAAGTELERAIEVAEMIAANAPLAVQSALANARAAERTARDAAAQQLRDAIPVIFSSADVTEGVAAMLERRPPLFRGV
jgi:enoyl-CoA hydratase